MRKYIRDKIRAYAKKKKIASSKAVKYFFNEYQIKKYGMEKRCANMAHGTHKKRTWPTRQAIADGIMDKQNEIKGR